MFRVDVHIKIGVVDIDFCVDGEIKSTWKDLTDTARIVLPKNIKKLKGHELIQDLIAKGDAVEIQLGYDGVMNVEFAGFVTEVEVGIPLVIHCEDYMWKLKQSTITHSWKKATLEDIVFLITPNDIEYECLDFEIGAFRIDKASPAQVLEYLKSHYGMKPFFRGKKLYVGFAYPFDNYSLVRYDFQRNVKEKGQRLKYTRKSDVKLKVKGISYLADGTKIEYETGNPEGAERTLSYYNVSKAALQENVQRDCDKLLYEGFRGDFKAFARPYVQHGDIANIKDDMVPDHVGTYFVDSVKTMFGPKHGIERTIEIGALASVTEIANANE